MDISSLGSGHTEAAQAAGRLASALKTERLLDLSITEGGVTPMVLCVQSFLVCAHAASEMDIVISQKANSQRCGHLFGTPNQHMVEPLPSLGLRLQMLLTDHAVVSGGTGLTPAAGQAAH